MSDIENPKKGGQEKDLRKELVMDEHKIPLATLCERLGTSQTDGMQEDAVAARSKQEGPNRLTPPPETPEWVKFMRTQTGFFSLLLWGGAVLCYVGYGLKEEVDNLYLGVVLTVVVLATGTFSYFQERKSSDLMDSFKKMMPTQCSITRAGKAMKVDAVELVRGDIVHVKAGDAIPADIRIFICSDDMKVDNSSLTGESDPQPRKIVQTHENPLETKNLAFFGTTVPSGSATGMVVNIGDNTVMGRIALLATETGNEQTPINREIEHFVKIVSGVAIFLGVTFFIIGIILEVDPITNLVFMIGIIVANVPEGLLATVTVCLTLTAKRMYRKQVLVKNLEAVETLGSTSCICSDKTGTLTQNIMTVANLVYDQQIWNAECSITREANFEPSDPSFQHLLRCSTLCNKAVFINTTDEDGNPIPFKKMVALGDGTFNPEVAWGTNGDASESALIKFVQPYNDILEARANNDEITGIPFNSTNKFQLSIHKQNNDDEQDRILVIKGAPERIISRCDKILLNGEVVEFTDEMRERTEELQLQLSRMGRRVLGFAEIELAKEEYGTTKEDYNIQNPNFPMGVDEMDLLPRPDGEAHHPNVTTKFTFLGLLALIDPPRLQVPGAVAKCKTAGIKVIMVTGDHPETAKAIAKEVGIVWGPTCEDLEEQNAARGLYEGQPGWEDPDLAPAIVVPGWTFGVDTTVEEWDDILDHPQVVFARTSPQQKLIIVENCQRRKEVVAVTGDGVNDAPALKKADIGVAMGIMGSDVSKQAADMILLDDNFASIVSGVEEGRLIFDNLKKSIAYTLSSNIPEIAPFLSFITIQVPLPLSTILILCVDLGTDMVPAISMAWENAEADIMRRNPRNAEVDRLVTKKLVCFAYLQIGVIQAVAGFYAWMTVLNDYGYPPRILPGLGAFDNWGKQTLFCQLKDGVMRNQAGDGMMFSGNYGGVNGAQALFEQGYMFWDADISVNPVSTASSVIAGATAGTITGCDFPIKNYLGGITTEPVGWSAADSSTYGSYTAGLAQVTVNSIAAMHSEGYVEYLPWKGRMSYSYDQSWLATNAASPAASAVGTTIPGTGSTVRPILYFASQNWFLWSVNTASEDTSISSLGMSAAKTAATSCTVSPCTGSDKMYTGATPWIFGNSSLTQDGIVSSLYSWTNSEGQITLNVASRMMQREANFNAQTAGFVCIIVVQWADLTICKTRWLSIKQQGMRNPAMNFGLLFETCLGAALCYSQFLNIGLTTRPLRLTHWFPGMPFSVLIFAYDEARKYIMRSTSVSTEDPQTKRITRIPGWVERNTYY